MNLSHLGVECEKVLMMTRKNTSKCNKEPVTCANIIFISFIRCDFSPCSPVLIMENWNAINYTFKSLMP